MTQILYFHKKNDKGVEQYYLAADRNISRGDDVVATGTKIRKTGRFILATAGNNGSLALAELLEEFAEENIPKDKPLKCASFVTFYVEYMDMLKSIFISDDCFMDLLIIDTVNPTVAWNLEITKEGLAPEKIEDFLLTGCASQAAGALLKIVLSSDKEICEQSFDNIFTALHAINPIISKEYDLMVWESDNG